MPTEYIAGQAVVTTIQHTHEPWTSEAWSEGYYVLANGALVSVGATIGKNVEIGFGSIVEKAVEIDDGVIIGDMCRIGDQTKVGREAKIEHRTTIDHQCVIGLGTTFGGDCHVGSMNGIPPRSRIGSMVNIGSECYGTERGNSSDEPPLILDIGMVAAWSREHVLFPQEEPPTQE